MANESPALVKVRVPGTITTGAERYIVKTRKFFHNVFYAAHLLVGSRRTTAYIL